MKLILLLWALAAVLVYGLSRVAVRFGVWEPGERQAQPPIINDLARTGALQLPPQPKS